VKQLEQELEIARQIQRGFLPQQLPQLPGWRIAAVCLPARETGGDFYEFVERTDGALGLIVGDVTGKSISAAMLMAVAQSLATAKGSDYASPARVMAETNRLLCEDVPKHTFVALSYALLSPSEGQICLSNGGQLDPFLVPAAVDRAVRLVETGGSRLPLGILPAVNYEETAVQLAPGDLLVFYTDGLVERKNGAGALFGFDRMAAQLEDLRDQPAEAALKALLQAADKFAAGVGPHDDTTLVVVQRLNEGY
jgi:serine phosphatase RsbU (regulator of sigma subunit)